jgi:hypothetical protein
VGNPRLVIAVVQEQSAVSHDQQHRHPAAWRPFRFGNFRHAPQAGSLGQSEQRPQGHHQVRRSRLKCPARRWHPGPTGRILRPGTARTGTVNTTIARTVTIETATTGT